MNGAVSAANTFNEAIEKIANSAINANNGQKEGTIDIGIALLNIAAVYRNIQYQNSNVLKAFYADFILPLETNLEKDAKVIQFEQKKFAQHHKLKMENYNKAKSIMRKEGKKKNNSEKELKWVQKSKEEQHKLDLFCEQSLKNAKMQERRRYGFILERQCSLANHWLNYHQYGKSKLENSLYSWNEISASREALPGTHNYIMIRKNFAHSVSIDSDDRSVNTAIKRNQSINGSLSSISSTATEVQPITKTIVSRANKSDEAINNDRPLVKTYFSYEPSGDNQLSFLEGDTIALFDDHVKGWHYGENLRTKEVGWFPISYANNNIKQSPSSNIKDSGTNSSNSSLNGTIVDESLLTDEKFYLSDSAKINDTINFQSSKKNTHFHSGPTPPSLPAPSPTLDKYNDTLIESKSIASSTIRKDEPNKKKLNGNRTGRQFDRSKNSEVSVENPPQPEVDYSDEEIVHRVPLRRHARNIEKLNATLDLSSIKKNKNPSSKSFWRFSKSEEILEGMAMWKHRDLVPSSKETLFYKQEKKEEENIHAKRNSSKKKADRPVINKQLIKQSKNVSNSVTNDKLFTIKADGKKRKQVYPNEDIQDVTKLDQADSRQSVKGFYMGKDNNDLIVDDDDSFYDGDSMQGAAVKSIKRKEILRQYYPSSTDSDHNSTSSDPYDCIVVDDHLVSSIDGLVKNEKYFVKGNVADLTTFKRAPESFKFGSQHNLLPRTKLSKNKKSEIEMKLEIAFKNVDTEDFQNSVNSRKMKPHNEKKDGWSSLWETTPH